MSFSNPEAITPIEIKPEPHWPAPLRKTHYVFLVDGDYPGLINGVHVSQIGQLEQKLGEAGYGFSDIERIVYTSWSHRLFGTAFELPEIDHFAFSSDMLVPTRDQFLERRDYLLELAGEIDEGQLEGGIDTFESVLEGYFAVPETADIDTIPIRGGETMRVSEFEFEVLAKRGPAPGHICLFDRDKELLFGGELVVSGLPDRVDDIQAYLVSLESLQELDAQYLASNWSGLLRKPTWEVSRTLRFMNNFLNHAPATMYNEPTIREFIENDRGRRVDGFVELVFLLEKYKRPLDELDRMDIIETRGEGLSKAYGIDVEDPRSELRP